MYLILLIGGALTAAVGTQIGNPPAVLAGVALVALTLTAGWLRRPHKLDSSGRWTCKNGHSNPAGARRCRMSTGCRSRY